MPMDHFQSFYLLDHERIGMNLMEWQQYYGTEEACAQVSPGSAGRKVFVVHAADMIMAMPLPRATTGNVADAIPRPLTAGTLFHSTNLPLGKWFWAIYLVASDKGGISALRLSRQINVSWITASRMLRKIRIAMGHRTASIDYTN